MKFLIFTSGSIDHAINSSVSGEGRWPLNLAKVITDHIPGSEIDLVGGSKNAPWPIWGTMDPIYGINLIGERSINPSKEYDVVLSLPWEIRSPAGQWQLCNSITHRIKARLYIHNTFSWTTGINNYPCWEQGHILVYPFKESYSTFKEAIGVNKFPAEFLPYPHGWEYSKPDFSRTELCWTSKDAFHPAWETRDTYLAEAALATLRAIATVSKKYNVQKVHFFTGRRIMDSGWNPFVAKYMLMDIMRDIPKPQIHDWLRYDQVGHILRTSKLSIPVCGLSSSITEAVCTAALPITYSGHANAERAKDLNLLMDPYTVTEAKLVEHMSAFMEDKSLYERTILSYQDFMADHQPKVVARKLEDIIHKYIK